jgi:hypothetical protein
MKTRFGNCIGFAFVLQLIVSCGNEKKKSSTDATDSNEEISQLGFASRSIDNKDLPPTPLNIPELVGFAGNQWTRPHLPPLRLNADGRLGVQTKGSNVNRLDVLLLAPEALNVNFHDSNGADILRKSAAGSPQVSQLDYSGSIQSVAPGWESVHSSLCEDFSIQNPSVCEDPITEKASDCYQLSALISARKDKLWRIISIPVKIRVSEPKTANAKITELTVTGSPTMSPTSSLTAMFEPLAVGDGRLYISRVGNSTLNWVDSSGKRGNGKYDVVYAWYPPVGKDGRPSKACDASRWSQLLPISHAPYDADVKAKYDFAKDLFRDGAGNILPDGKELGITYPWMDHQAKNLVFAASSSPLFSYNKDTKKVVSRFDVRCSKAPCVDPLPKTEIDMKKFEAQGDSQGFAVMGAWTRGKMTLFDNLINKADFGLGSQDADLRDVALYRSGSNLRWVTVGANRDTSSIENLPGYVSNTTLFDSIGDRFAFSKNFMPALSKDVVWLVSNGTMTDELAFDDYLDRDVLVSSDMSAPLIWNSNLRLTYNDGTSSTEPLIQNTAYISNLSPKFGRLKGKARVEPVAAGGRFGRGVFLGAEDSIDYDFPGASTDTTLFFSIFLNSRMNERSPAGEIARFPDGGTISISNAGVLTFTFSTGSGRTGTKTIELPPNEFQWGKWVHLSFLLEPQALPKKGFNISIFLNGMKYRQIGVLNRPFVITTGVFSVGRGFRGWIDEVRLVKTAPNLEEACNLAYGTLGAIDPLLESDAAVGKWNTLAALYPTTSHQEIKNLLVSFNSIYAARQKFVCLTDHSQRFGWSTRLPVPKGISYLRHTIHMAGKSFAHNQPRPDSTTNSFCLSCHSNNSLVSGLKISAPLKLMPTRKMTDDRRKQPTQPVAKIFGYTPVGFLEGSPETSGTLDVYRYLFP